MSDLDETWELLERTPVAFDALLRGISPAWHRAHEGPDTWSPIQVVGHLVHVEEVNWVPRAEHILRHGDDHPFARLDRSAHLKGFADWPLADLLDRFAELRRGNLRTVRGWGLDEEQLDCRGLHPELGPVRLRELLATWAVHDLVHLGQVGRVMAKRYADTVGPWQAYMASLLG